METVRSRCVQACASKDSMATLSAELKSQILLSMALALEANQTVIFAANDTDLKRSVAEDLAEPLLKRLSFGPAKLAEAVAGLRALADLDDPLGIVQEARELDQGLELYRISCPLGLVAMIFESRPDALVQMTGLALKSGNAIILKGGREAMESNRILARLLHDAACSLGVPQGWMVLLENREETSQLLTMHDLVDLIIPRGSNEFVQYIMQNSLIPVMGHADGICHAYIHASADLAMTIPLIIDSKTQYVAVCNAIETILIDQAIAPDYLPVLARALSEKSVQIFGCPRTCAILSCPPVFEDNWKQEYLDYKVSIKIVDNLEMAIKHINTYGSRHTELIIAQDAHVAKTFLAKIDAASVFWNASTRFADGFRYGLGAEVGISTGKLHARGPVGMHGLCTYKYKLFGHGQIVDDYAKNNRHFTHRTMNSHKEPW